MSFRSWVFVVAVGLVTPSWVLAQQSQEPIDQDAEGNGQQTGQNQSSYTGFPVRILEEPEQSESAKRQEAEANQRAKEDLLAQQLAAESAFKSVLLGAAQTVIAFFGTIGLIYSLFLNRAATKAAVEAVSVTRKIGQAQTRPYLGIDHIFIEENDGLSFALSVKNFGQSIASNVVLHSTWACRETFDEAWASHDLVVQPVAAIHPGQVVHVIIDARTERSAITGELLDSVEKIVRRQESVWLFGHLKYDDKFGCLHRTNFRMFVHFMDGKFVPEHAGSGNDAT